MYVQLLELNNRQTTQFENGQKNLNRHFFEKTYKRFKGKK